MREVGYDLSTHASKSLLDIPDITYDAVITMGCGDACPWIPARSRDDWDLPDPRDMDEADFRIIRDTIEDRVVGLLKKLNVV
jgi:protein-tyrosine-phosphatase